MEVVCPPIRVNSQISLLFLSRITDFNETAVSGQRTHADSLAALALHEAAVVNEGDFTQLSSKESEWGVNFGRHWT
jgi:hypothetical protein